jgi:AraC-like DNA-binding protein
MPGFADVLTEVHRGANARSWAADRGWVIDPSAGAIELLTREFRAEQFSVSLTRTATPATSVPARRPGNFLFAMVVSGELRVHLDGARAEDGAVRTVRQGAVLVADGSAPLHVEPVGTATVLTVQSAWSRTRTIDHSTRILPGADREARELRRILLALVTPVMAASETSVVGQVRHLRSAIESIVSAVIDQADLVRPTGATSAERDLLNRAILLLQNAAADPTFSTDELSRALGVSKAYVQRAFRRAGTTPLRYLAGVRAQTATRLLEERAVTRRTELEAIAHEAGFASVRSMRACIRRLSEVDRTRSFVAALRDDRLGGPLNRAA